MGNPNTNSVANDIKMAMLQKMSPEQRQSMLGQQGGPGPGEMGREGEMEPPVIDEAAMMQEMQGMPPQMPPQGAGGPPQGAGGPPQPLTPTPPMQDPLLGLAAQAIPGVPAGAPPPGAEDRFQAGLGQMDGDIQYSNQNNQAHAQRMGVSPEELQAATARGRAINGPGQQLQERKGSGNALVDYLMSMGQ